MKFIFHTRDIRRRFQARLRRLSERAKEISLIFLDPVYEGDEKESTGDYYM